MRLIVCLKVWYIRTSWGMIVQSVHRNYDNLERMTYKLTHISRASFLWHRQTIQTGSQLFADRVFYLNLIPPSNNP